MKEKSAQSRGERTPKTHLLAAGVFILAILLGFLYVLVQHAKWYYRDIAQVVPRDVEVFIEFREASKALDSLAGDEAVTRFLESSFFTEEVSRIPIVSRVLERLRRTETALRDEAGVDVRNKATLDVLLGADFAVAVRVNESRQKEILLVTKVNPAAKLAAELTGLLEQQRGRAARREQEYAFETVGSLIFASTSPRLLEESLALADRSGEGSLAADATFVEFRDALAHEKPPRVFAFGRLSRMAERWFPSTPEGASARSDLLSYARLFTMWPTEFVEDIACTVRQERDFYVAGMATLAKPLSPADQKELSIEARGFRLHRYLSPGTAFVNAWHMDFESAWQALAASQPPEVQAQFPAEIKSLEEFLGGRDFHDDILPSIGPEIATVAARQNFEKWGVRPEFPLPALAVYVKVRQSEQLSRDWEKAVAKFLEDIRQSQWEREKEKARREGKPETAQPPQPLYIRKSETYGGVHIHYFEFDVEKSDFGGAFVPAYAFVDDYFMASTSLLHIKDVIDQRGRGEMLLSPIHRTGLSGAHSQTRLIDFGPLLDVLGSNVETLAETRAGWQLREKCRPHALQEIRKTYTKESCEKIKTELLQVLRKEHPEETDERLRRHTEELLELQIEEDIGVLEQKRFEELEKLPEHQSLVEKERKKCELYLSELRQCVDSLVIVLDPEVVGTGESTRGILRVSGELRLCGSSD